MIAWIRAALGIGGGIGWIAYAVLFGLGLALGATPAYIWERRAVTAAEAQRDRYRQSAELASQDAQRWEHASDLRDQALEAMRATVDRQNSAIERLQISLEQASDAAGKAEAEMRSARNQFDERIREMEEQAHAHPNQVVPLGPIVRGRVDRLWD